ncbi:MAG: amidohydrolase family protein [Armatimonadota bacterium]|nr:amidohydrolase family protein [Armatimonadota bacterium]
MWDLLIQHATVTDTGPPVGIAVADGVIAALAPGLEGPAARTIDAAGLVVLPGLVESHIHLDKALLEPRRPNVSGTLQDAIAITAALKRSFTYEDIYGRAEAVVRWAIRRGVTWMRTHVEVDPIVGLTGLRALCALRETYRDLIDLQLVAFPQEGIFRAPGVADLLVQALDQGADLLGGVPYNDRDPEEHLDFVFDLAVKRGVDLDLHVDFSDDPSDRTVLSVAARTIARGYQGRVTVGHLTSLGAMAPEVAGGVIARIREARIHVVALPATDLYLNGRGPVPPAHRGLTPVRKLLDAGVNVAISSNNVRNAFTPLGRADPLEGALLVAYAGHMGGPAERVRLVEMVTEAAARVLRIETRYGLAPGCDADLVVVGSRRVADVVADQPTRIAVIKRGRVILETRVDETGDARLMGIA